MKKSEAIQKVEKILLEFGCPLINDVITNLDNIDFETASDLENEIEEIIFINQDGYECCFIIIDNLLIEQAC